MPRGAKFLFVVSGLNNLHDFEMNAKDLEFKMVQMLNTVSRDTRVDIQDEILRQVNFDKQYLNPSAGRLFVSKKAKRGDLETIITARGRPTSLARFIVGAPPGPGKKGVTVNVHGVKEIKSAFMIKLKAGNNAVETKFNQGLAIRLRPGEKLENKHNVVRLKSNLYILYGPSVSQLVMANSGKGIAEQLEPSILKDMEAEFLRLAALKGLR
jgi:hypothetical protein